MSGPSETTIEQVANALGDALPIAAAVVTALVPGAAAAAATGMAIAKGVVAGIPEAISLWNQFKGGTPPTQAQLDAYAATELTAYDQVMADIKAKLITS